MVLDLKSIRAERIFAEALQYALDHPERCEFVDQDALNAVLDGRWQTLDWRWNASTCIRDLMPKEPFIRHFAGYKPWARKKVGIEQRFVDEWRSDLAESPWPAAFQRAVDQVPDQGRLPVGRRGNLWRFCRQAGRRRRAQERFRKSPVRYRTVGCRRRHRRLSSLHRRASKGTTIEDRPRSRLRRQVHSVHERGGASRRVPCAREISDHRRFGRRDRREQARSPGNSARRSVSSKRRTCWTTAPSSPPNSSRARSICGCSSIRSWPISILPFTSTATCRLSATSRRLWQ